MNNQLPLISNLCSVRALEEEMRKYQRLNTSNVQYTSPFSGFTRNISVQTRMSLPRSANIQFVSISTVSRPTIIIPGNPLSSSSCPRFSAPNLPSAKPKTPDSSSSAGTKIAKRITVHEMSSGNKRGAPSGPTDDDDVMYLYTVDCTPAGRIVEEINLENDLETTSVPPQTRSEASTASQPPVLSTNTSRKRKSSDSNKSSRKKANKDHATKCCSCKVKYDESANEGKCFYVSRCGHVFCHPCVQIGGKSCKVCGNTVTSYRKMFV